MFLSASEVNGGIIAGAVIGALLALVLIVGIIVYCTRSSTNVSKLGDYDRISICRGGC